MGRLHLMAVCMRTALAAIACLLAVNALNTEMSVADEVMNRVAKGQEMQDAGEEMELFATSASNEDAAAKGEDMELLATDAQKHVSLQKYFVPAKDLTDPLPTKKQMKKFMKQADQGAKKAIKIMRRRRSYGDARDQWVDAAGHLHMGPGRRRVGSGMAKTKWVPPAYN